MKAVVYAKYGYPKVLKIADIKKPKPKQKEILVRVVCSAVTSADSRIRSARFPRGFGFLARLVFGIFKPRNKVLGSCFSGIVESVGKEATDFKVGDEVCGMTGIKMASYAEYIAINPSKSVAKKPKSVSHENAVGMLFGGTASLFFLRDKAGLQKGDSILINGASGAVGTNAVQLAKYFGAEVTAVTSSENFKLVSSLGAKNVIDYTKQEISNWHGRYNVVLDTVGNISIKQGKKLLKPKGRLVLMVASLYQMFSINKQVIKATAPERKEDIEFLLSLLETGKLKTVIDKKYNLDEVVDAHKHVDSGKKVGNIILQIGESSE